MNTQRKCNQHQEKQREEESKSTDGDAVSAVSAMTGNDGDIWGGSETAPRTGSSNPQLGINVNNDRRCKKECVKKWFDEFIPDSGTAFSVLANKKLAASTFKFKNPIDMHANLGHEILDHEAEAPGFGDMHPHEEGLTNTFGSDGLIQKGHRVVFDSDVENAFSVCGPSEELKGKFMRTKEGLHAMKCGGGAPANVNTDKSDDSDDDNEGGDVACCDMITTEKQAKSLCAPEQQKRAVRARRFFDAGGPVTGLLRTPR